MNPELLTGNPCGRYAAATSAGDTVVIDRLRENLSIPAESWFWKELILSQVRQLCPLDNAEYVYTLAMRATAAILEDITSLPVFGES